MKRIILRFSVLILFLYLVISCDTNEPPPEAHGLVLELEDISCTEAWIELSTINLQIPATVVIKQNNQTKDTINLVNPDTLLYIDSLLPNQSYTFQSIAQQINQSVITSNEINFTTMDTTSHNFSWQTWTFGEHDASFLWDVAILDENNIWAVGEIYMNDSLGQQDPNAYNAIQWNGTSWELKRITVNFRGNLITPILEGVCTFSTSDIWFVGSLPIHGDGENWIMYDLRTTLDPNISLSKVWGKSSNDIYFVGITGSIAHYYSTNWKKVESGTETRINDVWGIISNESKTILYCPVSSFFVQGDKKILKVVDGNVDSVSWNRDVRLYSTWAPNENILYVCGEGAYVNKFGDGMN